MNRAVFEVDVTPLQRSEFPGTGVRIHGDREETAPSNGHALARYERRELARPQVRFSLLLPGVRARDAIRGIVIAYAEIHAFRAACVAKQRPHDAPRDDGSLPAKRPAPTLEIHAKASMHPRIEERDELFEVIACDRDDLKSADRRENMTGESYAVPSYASHRARLAPFTPTLCVLRNGLAHARFDRTAGALGENWCEGDCVVARSAGIEPHDPTASISAGDAHTDRMRLRLGVGPNDRSGGGSTALC